MYKTRTGLSLITQALITAVMLAVFLLVVVPAVLEIAQGFKAMADNVHGALSTGKTNLN